MLMKLTPNPNARTITLDVEVVNRRKLRRAALVHALKFMSASDWRQLRQLEPSPMNADLKMLFDPGDASDWGIQVHECNLEAA